jgi:hypothetical protein
MGHSGRSNLGRGGHLPGGVPRLFCSAGPDGDFDGAVPDPEVVAQPWDAWLAEAEFATRFVAEAPDLDVTDDDSLNRHGGPANVEHVLVLWVGG